MMNYDAIPGELMAVNNWVCWKAIPDSQSHSGIRKIPINPITGGQAMSNNPQTWSDFITASNAARNYDGIGFMFSNSDYFGVDLDDCRDMIDSYLSGSDEGVVAEFINSLRTYAEYSQSGNGIHLICRGSLPPGGRRKGKVEMYDSGRFFIMTGNAIGDYGYISDCTERIKPIHRKYFGVQETTTAAKSESKPSIPPALSQQEIIEKILASNSGGKFSALYGGDFSEYPSQSEADIAFCSIIAFWCGGSAEMMDSIYRSSGLMRKKWDRKQSGSTYGAITINRAIANCQTFYSPDYHQSGSNDDGYSISIKESSGDNRQKLPMHTLDDTGNAERMNEAYGVNLRYNYTDKQWMYYKNGKWRYDDRGMVFVAADGVLRRMEQELLSWAEHEGGKFMNDYLKHKKRTRSNAAKRAMVKELEHLVPISPRELDTHKILVNSQSGVIDLETGRISPHNSDLYITKMLGTSMPVNPKSPVLWLHFLEDIFNGDKELIRYVQKSLGYSLSGLTKEQCVFFLYGSGRNGKSTFLEVVRSILGEYATNIQPESLMVRSMNNSANTDIARLKGARLVTSVEPNEGMRLNEGLVKQLTGDDVITARKLYGNEFEYLPEFKLWMATNHKPTIRGTDLGIWRRIHLIPFTVTIPDEKVDKDLGEKLNDELPDILAWMMDGYRLWKYEGLYKPKAVMDAVKEYQNEMDVISSFLNSDYVLEGGEVKSSVLYAVYCRWSAECNEYKMPARKFGIEIGKRLDKSRKSDGLYYCGLSVGGVSIGV